MLNYPITASDIEGEAIRYTAVISPSTPSYITLSNNILTVALSPCSQGTILYAVRVTISDPHVSVTPPIFNI